MGGLAAGGKVVVAGVGGEEPISVNGLSLVFGERTVRGTLTGSSLDHERTLACSVLQNIHAMTETVPLTQAAQAYAKMMSNSALSHGVGHRVVNQTLHVSRDPPHHHSRRLERWAVHFGPDHMT